MTKPVTNLATDLGQLPERWTRPSATEASNLARAIADPGAFTPRGPSQRGGVTRPEVETVAEWAARAVKTIVDPAMDTARQAGYRAGLADRTPASDGPWSAVLADHHGWVDVLDEVRAAYESGDASECDYRVVVVAGTCRPTMYAGADVLRLPAVYKSRDLLVEWDGFGSYQELADRLGQARAMAAGLNTFGAAPATPR